MPDDHPLPTKEESASGPRDWPHAPPHRLAAGGVYFVTARTAGQQFLLHTPERRDWFMDTLFALASRYGWKLEAWAILANHYHLVGQSPAESGSALSLRAMIRHLHSLTARYLNEVDGTPGRTRLWQNYRETCLTWQRGYLARLHYVHQNAVHHKLVATGSQWKWCSAQAFKDAVTPAWLKTVVSFPYSQIARADGE